MSEMATEKRLIDANECYELADHFYSSFYHHVADLPILRNLLNNCPTVDAVEVIHGRWEKGEADKHGCRKPKCSVCGEYHLAWWSDYTHCNYCPNCGAKMDGDGNGC